MTPDSVPLVRSHRAALAPLCAVAAALAAPGLRAQQATPATLPETVVTADRTAVPAEQVNASVTVITAEEIERRQLRTLNDALRDAPGVAVIQSGGPGKSTSVFLRGANANHTLVLIDGVRVGDPSQVNGAPNLAHFLLDNVERIEIVRGPMSTLWGSDAIGGVINLVTRKGSGALKATAFGELGSFGTFNAGGGVQGAEGRFNYNLALLATTTQGFSTVPRRYSPGIKNEPDGYWNVSFNGRVGFDVSDNFQLSLFSRYGMTRTDYDAFLSEDPNLRERTWQTSQRLQADWSLFDGRWKQTLGLSFVQVKRRDIDGFDPINFDPFSPDSRNRGRRWQLDWKNEVRLHETFGLVFGVDAYRDSLHARSTYNFGFPDNKVDRSTRTAGAYLNARWTPFEALSLTAGGRLEDHDAFGTAATFRLGGTYTFSDTGTRLRAAFGTAFKAPSLDQLYLDFPAFGFFANPNLKPERSVGGEVGVDQSLWGGRARIGVTLFRSDIRKLIASTACGVGCTTLTNVGKARSQGVEASLEVRPWETMSFRIDYTFTDARDRVTDEPLIRRPRHALDLTANWTPLPGWTLGAELAHRSGRTDRDFSQFPSPITHLEAYRTIRFTTSYDVSKGVRLFGRVENLTNRRYDEPLGFQAPRLGAYAGVRISL
ncbi:MAG: TonB-dependent receptor [Alphaproteobacteria bacterium]|nr:TonB-dependent receptor [Alphaproteobacteria bacterium]